MGPSWVSAGPYKGKERTLGGEAPRDGGRDRGDFATSQGHLPRDKLRRQRGRRPEASGGAALRRLHGGLRERGCGPATPPFAGARPPPPHTDPRQGPALAPPRAEVLGTEASQLPLALRVSWRCVRPAPCGGRCSRFPDAEVEAEACRGLTSSGQGAASFQVFSTSVIGKLQWRRVLVPTVRPALRRERAPGPAPRGQRGRGTLVLGPFPRARWWPSGSPVCRGRAART